MRHPFFNAGCNPPVTKQMRQSVRASERHAGAFRQAHAPTFRQAHAPTLPRSHAITLLMLLTLITSLSAQVIINIPYNNDPTYFLSGDGTFRIMGAGGGAPVGTMVQSGIVTQYRVPQTADTTGTNYIASGMIGDSTGTNMAVLGTFRADNIASTNGITGTTIDTGQGPKEAFGMDQDVLTTSSPTFPGMKLSPSGLLTVIHTNLATTPLAGLTLSNATPATAGVTVQVSPYIYWSGGSWLSTPTSNAPVVLRLGVVPTAGTTTAFGILNFDWSLNNGAFVNKMSLDSSGNIISSFTISAGGNVFAAAASGVGITARGKFSATADGVLETSNWGLTARATLQFNIPQITQTYNTNLTAIQSGLQFDNIGAVATNRLDLPTAVAKMRYMGYVDAAQRMQFQAVGADVIRDAATVSGAAAGIYSDTVGSTIELFSPKAGLWVVRSKNGTWTIE